jgi:methionyl-tRNA synthetase
MDHTQYLNAKPSIKVKIELSGSKGVLYLCSTYGCFDKNSDIKLVHDEVATFSCPHCRKDLKGTDVCELCGAPIVDFNLEKGGKVHFCSRIGCEKHYVSFEDIYETLTSFYHEYDYGARDTDF